MKSLALISYRSKEYGERLSSHETKCDRAVGGYQQAFDSVSL